MDIEDIVGWSLVLLFIATCFVCCDREMVRRHEYEMKKLELKAGIK